MDSINTPPIAVQGKEFLMYLCYVCLKLIVFVCSDIDNVCIRTNTQVNMENMKPETKLTRVVKVRRLLERHTD
jgi:hypothetical protein